MPRIVADKLEVTNSYFDQFNYDRTETYGSVKDVDLVGSETGSNGVCAEGSAKKGNNSVFLYTRDGQYDNGQDLCKGFE